MYREFDVSASLDLRETLARAKKIAQRVEAKGLGGGYTVEIRDRAEGEQLRKILVIEGTPARFDGWSFVGRAERLGSEWIVEGSPFYDGPSVDRGSLRDRWCDHCKTRRSRSKYVIIEREDVRLQVGATCVKDFLGHDLSAAWFKDPFEEFGSYGSGPYAHSALYVLALAHMIVRQRGYEGSQQGGLTRSLVEDLLNPHTERGHTAHKTYGPVTTEDSQAAEEILAFARNLHGSDYADNLRALLSLDYVEARRLGLAVSAVATWQRDKVKVAERKDRDAEKAELLAHGVRVPEGRVTVQGTVVSMRLVEDGFNYMGTWKMVVRSDAGWAVWLTVPSVIAPRAEFRNYGVETADDGVGVGDRVEFVATINPSDDPLFGFAKRPSKARILQVA